MYKWDLDLLFESTDSDKFKQELQNFKDLCGEINKFKSKFTNDFSNVEDYLRLTEKFNKSVYLLVSYFSLVTAVDTGATEIKTIQQGVYATFNTITEATTKAVAWIASFDIKELVKHSDFLKEHEFYLTTIKDNAQYILDEKTEGIMARLGRDGASAFSNLQAELTANVEVEFQGEKHAITSMSKFSSSTDKEVRKAAFHAVEAAYEGIAESVAFSLNSIKGWVNTVCDVRGYKDPLEKTLIDSRMEKKTLDALIDAIKEYLPHFRRYLKQKSILLSYDNGLPMYDLGAPIGKSSKKYTIEEAQEFVLENFKSFSDDLHNLAKRAFDENWVDYEPRKGKRGGAFCSNIHPIKQSRIMHNFNGTFGCVVTLAHELGHAYHGDCIFDNTILNGSYSMPVAETASILCENIVINNAMKTAEKEELIALLDSELKKSTGVCVDILSRFIFEDTVFKNREAKFMNATDLNKLMEDCQLEIYGDSIDKDNLSKYAWINKPHYYNADLSYYNFPYAFGALFGNGLYKKYLSNPEEFKVNYKDMLKATGYKSVEEVASMVNIDVTDINFWRTSLETIKDSVDKFIELTSK